MNQVAGASSSQSTKVFRWYGFLVSVLCAIIVCGSISSVSAADNPIALDTVTALDGSVWERVNIPGFGNGNNFSVVAMAEFQGHLYAMTRNQTQGTEVWRTKSDGDWEQVAFPNGVLNGIYGNPGINNVWARMIVFNEKLYFGFSSGLQGAYLGSTGCEIWRYDGTTWETVIADKKDINESGTITSISDCAANDTYKYAYIYNTGKAWTTGQWAGGVLQITSGSGQYRKFRIITNTATRLTIQQNEAAGTYSAGAETEFTICASQTYNNPFPAYSYTLGAVQVGDTYEIGFGTDENGFGDMWNKTITAMRVFDNKLYVSTGLNYENGGQVWYTADGDNWTVTPSVISIAVPYKNASFGNFHTDAAYPGSKKPVSSSVTDLVVSSVSGTPVLYAGGTGTSGNLGGCARMARLTATGWELIVDKAKADTNTTGSNENGFGSPSSCGTNQYNFMPWSLADFDYKLLVGISGAGARVLRAPYGLADIKTDGSWSYSVGKANIDPADPAYVDPLGTSAYPNGFDDYKYSDGNYQNLAVNLFPFDTKLYGGIITQYVPEYGIPPALSELKGAQIWKSPDGAQWSQITDDGFGDKDIILFEAFTDFDGKLYVSGSKGASSTPSGLGGAKIFRLASAPCVTVTPDQSIADKFQRHTVTGITTPLPVSPDVPGFKGAAFLTIDDIDGNGIKEIICTSGMGLSMDFYIADGAVAVFTWDGADISSWTQSIVRSDFAFPNETLIRDLDGDGNKDIMVFDNFLGGGFTNFPAGIYYLKNLGGDITNPANWEKKTIFQGNVNVTDLYERAKARSSYHRAHFMDIDGDGLEDFVTTLVSMEVWQARPDPTDFTNPCGSACLGQQYTWAEWFRKETDLVTYPSGFSGPYDIGDGGGFLFNMVDIDSDGDLDFVAPQFFILNPGYLVVKGPGDIRGDSLIWLENPGTGGVAFSPWERHTIDNWYTSPNPLGKGMEVIASDIDNDGYQELVFSSHDHQAFKPDNTYKDRIWRSGIHYLKIPENPALLSQWQPVSIDTGDPLLNPYDLLAVANDVYAVDRPGGPYSQGSPGQVRALDITGDGYAELVVPGDGKGTVYYYEAGGPDAGCLTYKRAALYADPACMPGESEIFDIDGDGDLDIISVIYDTSVLKDSASGSIFVFENTTPPPTTTTTVASSTTTTATPTLIELSSFDAKGIWRFVILTWETESEIDNAGFNIYRSESENGEYAKINAGLIPAQGSATDGASYKFVDWSVERGKTYYYKLEDIDLSGKSTLHGPANAMAKTLYMMMIGK